MLLSLSSVHGGSSAQHTERQPPVDKRRAAKAEHRQGPSPCCDVQIGWATSKSAPAFVPNIFNFGNRVRARTLRLSLSNPDTNGVYRPQKQKGNAEGNEKRKCKREKARFSQIEMGAKSGCSLLLRKHGAKRASGRGPVTPQSHRYRGVAEPGSRWTPISKRTCAARVLVFSSALACGIRASPLCLKQAGQDRRARPPEHFVYSEF